VSGRSAPAGRPELAADPADPADTASAIAIGFAIAGWVLYALLAPLAVFLTWWGDCDIEPCTVPGSLEQAAYGFDVLWWLVFPFLAWFAYHGRRWAWIALLAIAIVVLVQLAAAIGGMRGFSAFALTLPAAAFLTFGAAFGLAMRLPRFRDRPGAAVAGELAGIGCLAVVVAVIALQGLLVGAGGPLVGIAVVMAIVLFVIAVAAYANRDGSRGLVRRRRGRR
jgi:hypothetical protein